MQEHFYKYTDIRTAELILDNQSFRFSSPLKFNDPFDIQNDLTPSFDLNEFPVIAMSMIEEYIKNDYPISNPEDGFAKAILFMRSCAKTQGYKKSDIERITYPLLGHLIGEVEYLISQVNAHWQKSMKDSRVFCVTEDNDNLLMWAHYAENHTGVVFELATMPEFDTPLSVARKVKYTNKPVEFYSLEDLVKWMLFGIEPDASRLQYSNHAYRKSSVWSYENEWRVVDMCHYERKQDLFVDHKFIPKQLQKIFFGCKSDEDNIRRLSNKAKDINGDVEIYRARKMQHDYALQFEKI